MFPSIAPRVVPPSCATTQRSFGLQKGNPITGSELGAPEARGDDLLNMPNLAAFIVSQNK